MQVLINHIRKEYGQEFDSLQPKLTQKIDSLRTNAGNMYAGIRLADDGKVAGTINLKDVEILYLLVRYFKPKVIFEIGTWIGTSAMVMAEAAKVNDNGAIIYTCDNSQYYALENSYEGIIKTINGYSDSAIDTINEKIDFVFSDGELTKTTLKKMLGKLNSDSIIATHDYTRPSEKGVRNFYRVQMATFGAYNYLLPKNIESTIAVLLPYKGRYGLEIYTKYRLSIYLFALYLFVTTKIYIPFRRIYRKISNY